MRLLLTLFLLFSCATSWAQFDAPGIDPIYGLYQPNPYARLQNGANPYPTTPYRTEYYRAFGSDTGFQVPYVWDKNYSHCTIEGSQRMISSTQHLIGVPELWKMGYTGAGVKVCFLDFGYSPSMPHKDLEISGFRGKDTSTQHGTRMLSIAAARNKPGSGIIGTAYNAEVYCANITTGTTVDSMAAMIDWARNLGCRVLNISLATTPSAKMKLAIKRFIDDGGAVIVAAGNNGATVAPILAMAALPRVVAVGTTKGGAVTAFTDTFRHVNILPNGGHPLDFALPHLSICASYEPSFPTPPEGQSNYAIESGTSPAAAQLTGLIALLMERYPNLPGEAIIEMLRHYSRPFTDRGITARVPKTDFVKPASAP